MKKKSLLKLPPNPRLNDFQKYVALMVEERGFSYLTLPDIFLLFLEECGELAKSARKAGSLHTDKNSKEHSVDEEAADVFIYLLSICNYCNVDLEKAFRLKEEKNKKRTWK